MDVLLPVKRNQERRHPEPASGSQAEKRSRPTPCPSLPQKTPTIQLGEYAARKLAEKATQAIQKQKTTF